MVLPRSFVNLLVSMKSMNLAEEMSRSSFCWNSMIVEGPPKERSSQSCRGFSSHLWSDVAFDHWPTHKCNRALRRAYPMTVDYKFSLIWIFRRGCRIQTCNSDIREGAINHTTAPCTFLSENIYLVFSLSILKDLLLLDCHFYKAFFRQSGSAFSK